MMTGLMSAYSMWPSEKNSFITCVSLSTRISLPWLFITGMCCCPTGLMKPTFSKRFCRPLMSASDTVVFPTCWRVAATKIGLGMPNRLGRDLSNQRGASKFEAREGSRPTGI